MGNTDFYLVYLLFQISMSVFSPYFGRIRAPQAGEKVYKDECAYSFDNPVSIITLCLVHFAKPNSL